MIGGSARAWWSQTSYPLLALLGLLVLWEVSVRLMSVPTWLVPAPSDIASELRAQYASLWQHGVATAIAAIWGFGLAIVVGVPLAVGITSSRLFERSVLPLLVASQSIPKLALAPLFIIWFGFGVLPKVVMAFLMCFFPIVVSTAVGLRSVSPEMIHLVRSMGGGSLVVFRNVRFPSALPSIFAGLKTASALAVVGAVVGEFLGAEEGLGYLARLAQGNFRTPLLFAALVGLSIVGILIFTVVEALERLLIPWHISVRREATED